MTYLEFCVIVRALSRLYAFSVTSWGRTVARNKAVGGVKNSWHLDFLAVDCVLDDRADAAMLAASARVVGLDAVVYQDHVHLEPRGPRPQARGW